MQYPNTFLIISTLGQLLCIGNFFQGVSIINYIHKMTKYLYQTCYIPIMNGISKDIFVVVALQLFLSFNGDVATFKLICNLSIHYTCSLNLNTFTHSSATIYMLSFYTDKCPKTTKLLKKTWLSVMYSLSFDQKTVAQNVAFIKFSWFLRCSWVTSLEHRTKAILLLHSCQDCIYISLSVYNKYSPVTHEIKQLQTVYKM